VAFGLYAGEDLLDFAIFTDDERRARHAHHLLAVHVLFFHDAIGFGNLLIDVAQQREG